MDGVLWSPREAGTAGADLTARVTRLLAEVDPLRAEVAGLRRDNLEGRQQAGSWRSRPADAVRRIAALEQENEPLHGEVRQLQAERFGRGAEKPSGSDRSQEREDPADDQPKRRRGRQPGQAAPRRRDYSHRPAREEFIDLPEAEPVCPPCGRPLKACGSDDSEPLEIEITVYRRVIHRRRGRRTWDGPGPRTFTAAPPPKRIPKSLRGASVWVEILLDKFASHGPTQRLLEQWRFGGLDLAAGAVTDGLQRLEPLWGPILEALLQRNRPSHYQQADETRWLVFVEQQGQGGFGWWLGVFHSEDTVAYLLDDSRSHRVPEDPYPPRAGGVLRVDRYRADKALLQVKNGGLILAFCRAHVRRDFVRVGKGWPEWKPRALAGLQRIRDLYRWDRRRRAEAGDPAAPAGREQAVAAMRQQLDAEWVDLTLRTPACQALTSLQEHWSGWTLFVADPRMPMDNHLCERRWRGPAVGRKNYYGSGALWSGRLAATLFSIWATLPLWQIHPRLWFNGYLQSCAEAGGQAPSDIEPFLPWKRSPDIRRKLRLASPTQKTDTSGSATCA
jgi:transposase